jgi:hypothetical protein
MMLALAVTACKGSSGGGVTATPLPPLPAPPPPPPPPQATVFTPEAYGATGGADDTNAFQALAAAVNANGGGIIEFMAGRTYHVGRQTFGPARTSGRFVKWTGVPEPLIELKNCTKPITVKGNGATIEVNPGRYGTFDQNGVRQDQPTPYYGEGISAYYVHVIDVESCSGFFDCRHLTIDGNIDQAIVGGEWGDVGRQLGGNVISIRHHTGGWHLQNLNMHHHTSDPLQVWGPAVDANSPMENGRAVDCQFTHSGRLGAAIVGGRGFSFQDCKFNYNGTPLGNPDIISAPASGVDIEAEGGRINRDHKFIHCEFIGNGYTQFVADQGPSSHITLEDCLFVSTNATSAVVWPNKPHIKFKNCTLAGTVVNPFINPATPAENCTFDDCRFTNDGTVSPTGTVGTNNNNGMLFNLPNGNGIVLTRCRLEHTTPTSPAPFSAVPNAPALVDCTIYARNNGYPLVTGVFSGKTEFIEEGGAVIQAVPGGGSGSGEFGLSKVNAGPAYDPWVYTRNGVSTTYPATTA